MFGRSDDTAEDGTRGDGGIPAEGVIPRRVTVERDKEFVVFHVGMRVNALWKIHRWLSNLLIAPRMVRELSRDLDSGLLGSRTVVGPGIRNHGFVQYWESFEELPGELGVSRDGATA